MSFVRRPDRIDTSCRQMRGTLYIMHRSSAVTKLLVKERHQSEVHKVATLFSRLRHGCQGSAWAAWYVAVLTSDNSASYTTTILRMMRNDLLTLLTEDVN